MAHRVLVDSPEGKRLTGRHKGTGGYNIKMDIKEI
jgi:hypothetical protein